ncbi:MAG: hypothetical protein LUE98_09685 [Tannerellaceae bacterium]|nr:hypothetical protein [Tannerellaceae bacterium]
MVQTYFMHIDSINLVHYFSGGCLKPARYIVNRNEDVQSRLPEFLIFSDKRYAKGMDCSLEIVLTQEDLILTGIESVFLYDKPLPITRIKNIYFQEENTRDKTRTIINMGSGFLPDSLTKTLVDRDCFDYSQVKFPVNLPIHNWEHQLKKYDSLLGGFALMKLAVSQSQNYSSNYFSTLSRFNSVIAIELKNAGKGLNRLYWDAFEGKDSFEILYPYINKQITESDVYDIAKKENQQVQKRELSGIIDIESLGKGSYIIAVLYTFGLSDEGRKKKIDSLILSNFQKEINPARAEVVALCYGLNRGYSVFHNKYNDKIVKFKLDSQLDYYTIESLYQTVFGNGEISNRFPYLDKWCPRQPVKKLKDSEYRILDINVIDKPFEKAETKTITIETKTRLPIEQTKTLRLVREYRARQEEDIRELYRNLRLVEEEEKEDIAQKNAQITALTKELNFYKQKAEELSRQLYKINSQNVRTEPQVVSEGEMIYNKQSSAEEENYKQMFEEAHILLNKIGKISAVKNIKPLIKEFNSKYPFIDLES